MPLPGGRGQRDDGVAQEPAARQRLGEPPGQLPRPRVDFAGGHRVQQLEGLALPDSRPVQPRHGTLDQILAGVSVGPTVLAEAAGRSQIETGADKLLARGTDLDAKGVGSMIPGINAAQIATAMRAAELCGRLRRANERVPKYQNALPIAAQDAKQVEEAL